MTGRLSIDYPASYVASALNSLPSISPATVSVTATAITGGTRYTVTFNGDGGKAMLGRGLYAGGLHSVRLTMTILSTVQNLLQAVSIDCRFTVI